MIEYTVKVYSDRTEWYLNGELHREIGPAIDWADGSKSWFLNGKRHRADGPAIEHVSGPNFWYLNGASLTEAEFNARKMNPCNGKVIEIDGVKYKLQPV